MNCFFVRHGSRYQRIDISAIVLIEANKNYCKIQLTSGSFLVLIGMKDFEEVLPGKEFCRVHRSWIISIAHLRSFDSRTARVGDYSVPVSVSYYRRLQGLILPASKVL